MLAEALRHSFRYDRWATEKIFNAAEGLAPEQFTTLGSIPHGSIQQTLLHMLTVHRRFLSWWDGSLAAQEAYALRADADEYPDLAAVRAYWQQIADQSESFISTLTDEDAAQTFASTQPNGAEFSFILWQMMLHVCTHNIQHRSEIAVMLTEAGYSPGDVDLIFYQLSSPA